MSIQQYLKDKLKNKGQYTPIYHGVKLDVAINIIDNNKMEARTTQRYWEDGRKRKDNSSDYETSKWMKGWSMTRNFDYAFLLSGLVLEFDKNELNKEFKIEPISWNYTIGRMTNADHKRETEEFVIGIKTGKSTQDYERIADDIMEDNVNQYEITKDINQLIKNQDFSFVDLLKQPEGNPILDVNNKLKSIYISDDIVERFGLEDENIQKILNHPKFKGILNKEEFSLKTKSQEQTKNNISIKKRMRNN